ncbi:DeoR/GlpR family DNA-binding transcription regulator [Oceanobacillus caeni]|uniref:DeoR/GlpR family DNA-binding transcription regulator n=1 Tax=Oceanobacillus caeni TaxID=405946 RepID=UPI002149AE94|nr:DeoR/GlpR family DNA-binding transcription regulator [Oceanobacillus caeni]MCR1834801.1 DeoR/GlpR family DNA-binding transcription regulator [Oceanobacillus caeni]MED4474479.1 DeoR/GlpR family DNA-binding transcription regulator [Oceanobacillus caeni]
MKMFATERRDRIIDLLQERKRITVKELSSEMGVSEATLRADLNKMELDGLLTRTHGGAVLNDEKENETSFNVRQKKNKVEKAKIASKAFQHIEEKQCILLDASSTALELAQLIKDTPIRLTIVTTGLQTALELKENPDITVILVGGVVTNKSTSIEGTLGLDILDSVNIDIMFTSANGFTVENGLEDFNLYEVQLKREIVKRASKVIALIDSSKIGKSSSAVFAKVEQVDKLITDEPIHDDIRSQLLVKNVEIIIAD